MAEFMRLSAQPRSMTKVGALFVIASFKLMSPLWAADAETTFAPAVTVIQSKRSCFADALEVHGHPHTKSWRGCEGLEIALSNTGCRYRAYWRASTPTGWRGLRYGRRRRAYRFPCRPLLAAATARVRSSERLAAKWTRRWRHRLARCLAQLSM